LQRDPADADPADLLDQQTDAFKHPVDLPVPALNQGHSVPGVLGDPQQMDRLEPGDLAVEPHAGA